MPREAGQRYSSATATATGSQRRKTGSEVAAPPVDSGAQSRPRVVVASNMEPTYYIGGGNGNALIEETLNSLGWRRIKDKADDNYRLRWCELKSSINYNTFKEGDQMVNHIPNCNLLTNKLGLLDSLQDYSRVCSSVQRKAMKLDFIPETYRLDDAKDRQTFEQTYKENETWICKPTGRNQGKGIFLVRSLSELNQATEAEKEGVDENKELGREGEAKGKQGEPRKRKSSNRIIQRYITNPLLVDGKKFDIRCYMLIASTAPYVVLYHKGYLRLSMYEYDNSCDNIIAHLTNQFIQKKDPKYNELKEETAWSMDRFNHYVNEKLSSEKGLEEDWVYGTLTTTMKQIMTYAFTAVKHKLQRKVGYFDLYGLDFMIDENMKVWLIEMNVNPCLATNCAALREVVPGVVRETLHLSIECFEKSRKGRPILPLSSLKNFQLLFSDAAPSSTKQHGQGGQGGSGTTRTQTAITRPKGADPATTKPVSPTQRSRSISPAKDRPSQPRSKKTDPGHSAGKSKTPTGVDASVRANRGASRPPGNHQETPKAIPEEGEPRKQGDNEENTGTNPKTDSIAQGQENAAVISTPVSENHHDTTRKKPATTTPINSDSGATRPAVRSTMVDPTAATKRPIGKGNSALRNDQPNRGS